MGLLLPTGPTPSLTADMFCGSFQAGDMTSRELSLLMLRVKLPEGVLLPELCAPGCMSGVLLSAVLISKLLLCILEVDDPSRGC